MVSSTSDSFSQSCQSTSALKLIYCSTGRKAYQHLQASPLPVSKTKTSRFWGDTWWHCNEWLAKAGHKNTFAWQGFGRDGIWKPIWLQVRRIESLDIVTPWHYAQVHPLPEFHEVHEEKGNNWNKRQLYFKIPMRTKQASCLHGFNRLVISVSGKEAPLIADATTATTSMAVAFKLFRRKPWPSCMFQHHKYNNTAFT